MDSNRNRRRVLLLDMDQIEVRADPISDSLLAGIYLQAAHDIAIRENMIMSNSVGIQVDSNCDGMEASSNSFG